MVEDRVEALTITGVPPLLDGELALREHGIHDLWHGHPIPWSRLPVEAKDALVAAERLDAAFFRKAVRKGWGREFDA